MSLRISLPRAQVVGRFAALTCAAVLVLHPVAHAGHEVPYYPSFYPQEIRIEPLNQESAAREFANSTDPLHAYVGTAPQFTGDAPAHLKSVVSLRSFITVSINAQSRRAQGRAARCQAVGRVAAALAKRPDVVVHPYPVTPYHADYLGHVDVATDGTPAPPGSNEAAPALTLRTGNAGIETLLSRQFPTDPTDWDFALDEVPVSELMGRSGIGFNAWPAPPWAKEGWFQTYHLLRPALSDRAAQKRADASYERLTRGEFQDLAEQLNLARGLVAALSGGCERSVIGYRLRREFYNDDFSNGIENIAVDSQFGFNSPVFARIVKLKDFPWNGWLRLGIDRPPAAAWNPLAGFTDTAGRLVWSVVGDDAFLPVPYNSRWIANRVEIGAESGPRPKQSMRIPGEAVMAAPGTGTLGPIGEGHGASAKLTYRVLASSFHDGSEMEPADLLFPYALAFRWSSGDASGPRFDPEIAAATRLMRERLKAVRITRVEETTLTIADKIFNYRQPIIEVYLDSLASDEQDGALLAPPWSSVPWHVLALMEAAVESGVAAFSRSEAQRRRIAWLDLVRDPEQRTAMTALIKEFAKTGYRPAALEGLVSAEAAKARWEALDKFVETRGHLLVTNGAYRLSSWSPEAFVFEVVRDFTYPIGLGTFNAHAYPPRALITKIEREGKDIVVAADVEMAIKEQRNRRIVRMALKRDTLRETLPIRPVPQYVIVGDNGQVAAAGTARWEPDGRFTATLPPRLAPGAYSFFTAIFLDGNTVNPAIARLKFRSN